MVPRVPPWVSLLLLLTTFAPSVHGAAQSGEAHRHLRHQLVAVENVATIDSRQDRDDEEQPTPSDITTESGSEYMSNLQTAEVPDSNAAHEEVSDDNTESDNTESDNTESDNSDDASDSSDDDNETPQEQQQEVARDQQQEQPRLVNFAGQKKKVDAKMDLAVKDASEALAKNLETLDDLRKRKARLENTKESDKQIDASVRLVTNETESAAMAGMLGNMWKEMRMFATPMYIKYLEDQIKKEEAKTPLLRKQLEAAQAGGQVAAEIEKSTPLTNDSGTAAAAPAPAPPSQKDFKTQLEYWWNLHRTHTLSTTSLISSAITYVFFGVVFAFLYDRFRRDPKFLAVQGSPSRGTWSTSIFGCLSCQMCLMGFCCPCIRWADTVDKARMGMSYWPAFLVMFLFMGLDTPTLGISGLIVVLIGVYYRQKLRKTYQIPSPPLSIAEDCFFWCLCTPCAIIQEAQEEALQQQAY